MSSRWADCDAYAHANNAVNYSWFDTALSTLAIERGILRQSGQTSIGLCVSCQCRFLAPIGFPETVDMGVRLASFGRSSITYVIAIFREDADEASAICHFTHVNVDADSRGKVSLIEQQKSAMKDLVRGGTKLGLGGFGGALLNELSRNVHHLL